jgi:hypothetical protein
MTDIALTPLPMLQYLSDNIERVKIASVVQISPTTPHIQVTAVQPIPALIQVIRVIVLTAQIM